MLPIQIDNCQSQNPIKIKFLKIDLHAGWQQVEVYSIPCMYTHRRLEIPTKLLLNKNTEQEEQEQIISTLPLLSVKMNDHFHYTALPIVMIKPKPNMQLINSP